MRHVLYILSCGTLCFFGCPDPTDILEEEATTGKILFQLAEDCGGGALDIYVNEQWIGTLDTYRSDGGPFCGDAPTLDHLATDLPFGTHTVRIVAQGTGAQLTDAVFISSNTDCTPFRILCSRFGAAGGGGGSGGGSGSGAPGRIIFQRNSDCETGNWDDYYLDGAFVHRNTKYWPDGGPACNWTPDKDHIVILANPGSHTINIRSEAGGSWTDEVTVTSDGCLEYAVTCSMLSGNNGGSGGGGGGTGSTPPGKIIFQRNDDCQAGWVEYYINDQLVKRSSYLWPNGGPYCHSAHDEDHITAWVDPGTYTLKTVSQAGGTYTSQVTVSSDGCVEYPVTCSMLSDGNGGGGGNSGGGGGSCDWNSATQFITVVEAVVGTRCNSDNSIEVTVRNDSNGFIKAGICLQRANGTWYSTVDGTFNEGLAPGKTKNWYLCEATGSYGIWAMSITDYLANDCRYPTDAQCQ
ncbi:hypothetical protein CLV84_1340 [Neolewinella xylanilytica]|uniref:Uncharacterized protein n=1 Tax=Neolewinella xylanilytica TaxID=1514080 RepID=A0A2S6IA43_9BACT|nr:hypothetical protein [Neolewinella xylanilytica]PPK88373.1 hypothetical protein CLV84_1340 [Neolewinella xylanilytica]